MRSDATVALSRLCCYCSACCCGSAAAAAADAKAVHPLLEQLCLDSPREDTCTHLLQVAHGGREVAVARRHLDALVDVPCLRPWCVGGRGRWRGRGRESAASRPPAASSPALPGCSLAHPCHSPSSTPHPSTAALPAHLCLRRVGCPLLLLLAHLLLPLLLALAAGCTRLLLRRLGGAVLWGAACVQAHVHACMYTRQLRCTRAHALPTSCMSVQHTHKAARKAKRVLPCPAAPFAPCAAPFRAPGCCCCCCCCCMGAVVMPPLAARLWAEVRGGRGRKGGSRGTAAAAAWMAASPCLAVLPHSRRQRQWRVGLLARALRSIVVSHNMCPKVQATVPKSPRSATLCTLS